MSWPKAGGNVTATGVSPAGGQAPGHLPRFACKPSQRGIRLREEGKATAPKGFEPRREAAAFVVTEAAPSGRTTDAWISTNLFKKPEGLNMEKITSSFFYTPMKSIPVNGLVSLSKVKLRDEGYPLQVRSYTLCELGLIAASAFPPGHPVPKKPNVPHNSNPKLLRIPENLKVRQNSRCVSLLADSDSTKEQLQRLW